MPCPSETRLQAFVDGDLSEDEIDAMSKHLDGCDECRTLVGAVQPLDDAHDHIGRYVLRRVLGKGGMGVVYEAVDPELHREVALKVLHSAELGDEQQRLLAEAQNLAKLSHPNVVTVHDVGRAGERVFIVMALIQGVSLRHWRAQEARTVPEILDAFEQAAEGLRAAHEAGLVHRDFKPENVFVANDGRVVVGDFGLAIPHDTDPNEAAGSLAYMAPEQKRGEKVDARSDQYSFCVSLDESLRDVPAVPRWLSAIVARGKSEKPGDRFESMAALIAAMQAGRRRSRKRRTTALVTAGLVALALGGLVGVRVTEARRVDHCKKREVDMSALWSADVARKIEGAFRATSSPLAEGTWRKANAVLTEYTASWNGAHARACELNPVIDPQRSSCLEERLEIMRSVTTSLEHVDAPMLEQVPSMLQVLPRIAACEDAREIAQQAPPPSADKAAAVDAAKKKIADATVTIASGRYQDGLTRADDAFKAANATSYLPVVAEAYLAVGTARGRLGHAKECEQALDQAVSSASAGRSSPTAIRAWIELMHFVGYEAKRYDDGARWADYAKAALESIPSAYDLEAERLAWSRAMLLDQKRFDDALVVSRQELALVELRFGSSHRLSAAAQDGLAGVLAGQCRAQDAIEPQEKACAVLEKEYGTPHPQLALCLGNLAALHSTLGHHELSLDLKKRALAMFERVPGHPNHVGMTRRNMVRSLLELERLPEASAELDAAAALSRRAADEFTVMLLRGDLHRREGKLPRAWADHTAAVARAESLDPSRRIEALLALAETDLAGQSWNAAARNAEQAASLARSVHGENSCRLAAPLRAQADAFLGSNDSATALPLAEKSLSLYASAQLDPLAKARAQFAVARALPTSDHDRAKQLATSAREASTRDAKLTAKIDAWLTATDR